jgi:DNA-binding GntR family transcriptional regulator
LTRDDLSGGSRILDPLDTPSSLVDQAHAAIRSAVVSRKIPPGSQLRQNQLAEELGVSPRTVREALNRLVAEGLAVYCPRKGVSTVDLSVDTMKEIYHMRLLLEGWAFELAAERLSTDDLARMRELLPLTVDPDPEAAPLVRNTNRDFHWIAIRSTGMEHLIRILEQLWGLTSTHLFRDAVNGAERSLTAERDLAEHAELLEALEARDGPRARRIVRDHIQRTLDVSLARMRIRDQR